MKGFWSKSAYLTILCCTFLLLNSSLVVLCENPNLVTVYFFDVGQGDSIFIDTNSLDVLIDGGPQKTSAALMSYLGELNISRIDIVVATHPHEDHMGGLVTVLNSSIVVNTVLYNGEEKTTQVYLDFISLAQDRIALAKRGQVYILDVNVNFTTLNPVQPLEFDEANSNSIALKLQVGNVAFLFTGDAGLNLESQVLKVAHHGSKYATSTEFLEAVNPTYAVISAGLNNSYGHPHNETIQRLLNKGVTIYGTHVSGTIIMSTNGQTIQVHENPTPISEFSLSVVLCLMLVSIILIFSLRKTPRS